MTNVWMMSALVGVGGFAGSVARHCLSVGGQRFALGWPLGTLASNVLGCLVIGVVMELSTRGETVSPEVRLAIAVGFCGGFTTMSSMIYEALEMVRASEYVHATLYVGGSLLLSMTALLVGVTAVRVLIRG